MSNSATTNKYALKAKISEALQVKREEAKGKVGKSFGIATVDLITGGLAGGLAGAAVGKHSLWIGFLASAAGNYMGQPLISTAGIGMMASGGYQAMSSGSVSGLGGTEEAKQRIKAFGANLKERFFLDKIIKPKEAAKTGTNGLGNVQYFKYPHNVEKELDMGALDQIEQEIAGIGAAYESANMDGANDWQVEEKIY